MQGGLLSLSHSRRFKDLRVLVLSDQAVKVPSRACVSKDIIGQRLKNGI